MATSEERLEQLKRSLQQAGSAPQAANCRVSSLETAAGCDNRFCLDPDHS